VTNAGMAGLRRLTGLQNLNLNNTQVTDVAVKNLQKAIPDLTVER